MKENETLLDKANQNLNIANTLYETYRYDDEAYLNYVGYHLQQSVELSLKFCLEINGVEYPKTHDITQLIALINKSEVDIPLTEYIDDHSEMFSLWESRTRYILNYRLEEKKVERALTETYRSISCICEEYNLHLDKSYSEESLEDENEL